MKDQSAEDVSQSYLHQWVHTQTRWRSDHWECGEGWVLLKTQTPPADSSARHETHQTYKAKTAIIRQIVQLYDCASRHIQTHLMELFHNQYHHILQPCLMEPWQVNVMNNCKSYRDVVYSEIYTVKDVFRHEAQYVFLFERDDENKNRFILYLSLHYCLF